MTTTRAPTLADQLIREYAKNKHIDPAGWMIKNISQARKFVLDDAMSAFTSDLSYACTPKSGNAVTPSAIRRGINMLEDVRHSARLPHAKTWIEFNLKARIKRACEAYQAHDSNGVSLHPDLGPDKGGWLMLQHPAVETAFMAIECVSHSVIPSRDMRYGYSFRELEEAPLMPVPNASPMAYCWTVDETVPPWPLIGQGADGKYPDVHHRASMMLTGVPYYEVPQVGWTVAPWAINKAMKPLLTYEMFIGLQKQLASDLRYLWALLAAINDTPVSYRAVTPVKGHMVAGSYKKFSTHSIITLQVPYKITLQQLAKRVARAARRRAHQVRGHFRKDYRHPGTKIWIKEHQRGDASLGFVLHDYNVEHPV